MTWSGTFFVSYRARSMRRVVKGGPPDSPVVRASCATAEGAGPPVGRATRIPHALGCT